MPILFFLGFDDALLNSFDIKHIQYNIEKKLEPFTYITYTRIDIKFKKSEKHEIEITFNNTKRLEIIFSLTENFYGGLTEENTIRNIYKRVLEVLIHIWQINNWNLIDLDKMFLVIEQENFKSEMYYGKPILSPNKKFTAKFYCELFAVHTSYYLEFWNNNARIKKIFFLDGFTDPAIVFNFFSIAFWKDNTYFFLKDLNKEIIFVFDINDNNFTLEFKPNINSANELANYVKAFQAGVSRDEMSRLLRLPEGFIK